MDVVTKYNFWLKMCASISTVSLRINCFVGKYESEHRKGVFTNKMLVPIVAS